MHGFPSGAEADNHPCLIQRSDICVQPIFQPGIQPLQRGANHIKKAIDHINDHHLTLAEKRAARENYCSGLIMSLVTYLNTDGVAKPPVHSGAILE